MESSPEIAAMLLFFRLDPITLLVDSLTEIRHLQSGFLVPSISERGIGWSDPPYGDYRHFKGGSADYGLKSTCGSEWKSFLDGRLEVRPH